MLKRILSCVSLIPMQKQRTELSECDVRIQPLPRPWYLQRSLPSVTDRQAPTEAPTVTYRHRQAPMEAGTYGGTVTLANTHLGEQRVYNKGATGAMCCSSPSSLPTAWESVYLKACILPPFSERSQKKDAHFCHMGPDFPSSGTPPNWNFPRNLMERGEGGQRAS